MKKQFMKKQLKKEFVNRLVKQLRIEFDLAKRCYNEGNMNRYSKYMDDILTEIMFSLNMGFLTLEEYKFLYHIWKRF